MDDVLFIPLVVRVFRCDLPFDFVVVDDALFLRVDEEHLARFQPALVEDFVGRNVDDADFRAGDDPVVPRDVVAGRA